MYSKSKVTLGSERVNLLYDLSNTLSEKQDVYL